MAYKTASPDIYKALKANAREHRKNPTLAEQVLWRHIRDNALGVKFLRQHIIEDFIADFVSLENRLIIEVDGAYHTEQQQIANDELRTAMLGKMGFRVIRVTNEEVLYNTIETIEYIKKNINMENQKIQDQRCLNPLPHREGRGGSVL